MTATTKPITLAEFLKLPETKPASEFIDGQIYHKPMPKGKHSTLQSRLADTINEVGLSTQIAYAFPELRCTFGGRSIIPDVAVFRWERIPFDAEGEVANIFELSPDWTIEILSPDQSQTKVTVKTIIKNKKLLQIIIFIFRKHIRDLSEIEVPGWNEDRI